MQGDGRSGSACSLAARRCRFGGHGNLWVAKTDGSAVRQITFEQDPSVVVGVPLWSPVDNRIVFVVSRGHLEIWMVNADGRGLHQAIPRGLAPCWSPDGQWIYYSPLSDNEQWRIEKIPAGGGPAVLVRDDANSHAPVVSTSALYFATRSGPALGSWEIRRASPENGPSEVLAQVAGSRLPVSPLFATSTLSRDGRSLALPMADGGTSNVWVLPVEGGSFTPVTDFGDRPTIIARQVSWSPDSGSIYAAVAEINGDIVLLDGLV